MYLRKEAEDGIPKGKGCTAKGAWGDDGSSRSGSSILTCGHWREASPQWVWVGGGRGIGWDAGAWSSLFRTFPFLAWSDSWCSGVFPGLCSAVAVSLHVTVKGHIPYIPNNSKEVGMGGWANKKDSDTE